VVAFSHDLTTFADNKKSCAHSNVRQRTLPPPARPRSHCQPQLNYIDRSLIDTRSGGGSGGYCTTEGAGPNTGGSTAILRVRPRCIWPCWWRQHRPAHRPAACHRQSLFRRRHFAIHVYMPHRRMLEAHHFQRRLTQSDSPVFWLPVYARIQASVRTDTSIAYRHITTAWLHDVAQRTQIEYRTRLLHRVSKNRTRLLCLITPPKIEQYQ